MIVTITEYDRLGIDVDGKVLPIGGHRLGSQGFTAEGVGVLYNAETRFVRIATDTSIHIRLNGSDVSVNDELVLAGSVEFFQISGKIAPSILEAG